MILARRRQIFSEHFCKLILWGLKQDGIHIIIDEVRRGKQQALWNASHCRSRKTNGRCELERMAPIHTIGMRGAHDFRPIGIVKTIHGYGLGGDLLVYRDWKLLKESEEYLFLGEKWESMTGEFDGVKLEFKWGGRWKPPKADGGHFSVAYAGVQ